MEGEEPGGGSAGEDGRTGWGKRNTPGRNRATPFAQGRFTPGAFPVFTVTTKTQHWKKTSSARAAPRLGEAKGARG